MYTLTKYAKSATQQFGYAIVTPTGFDPAKKYPIVIVGHDSTKVGDGSSTKLSLVTDWAGYTELKAATDVFNFVIIFIQTAHEFEYGELQFAVSIAKSLSYASTNNIHFYGLDIAGKGFIREAGLDYAFASSFATVKLDMMLCVTDSTSAASNLVTGKVPVWFSHAANDPVANTSCSNTPYTRMTALSGSIAFYTQYVLGEHAISSRTLTAYGQSPNTWLPATPTGNYASTGFNSPKMSWYQWVMSNKRGQTFISPSNTYVPPTTNTKTIIATVNVYSDGSVEKISN